jgi:epoxyqueuosine reductase
VKFSRVLTAESPYAARDALGGKDTRPLAREILGMTQPEFSAAFKDSPMQRAKRRGLKRNAAVVLGNPSPGSTQAALAEDVDVLTRALDDEEPLVRERAALALG